MLLPHNPYANLSISQVKESVCIGNVLLCATTIFSWDDINNVCSLKDKIKALIAKNPIKTILNMKKTYCEIYLCPTQPTALKEDEEYISALLSAESLHIALFGCGENREESFRMSVGIDKIGLHRQTLRLQEDNIIVAVTIISYNGLIEDKLPV